MLKNFSVIGRLWLVCAIAIFFNVSCSYDPADDVLLDDEDVVCDAQCELDKLCGNGSLDGAAGEVCDIVDDLAGFKDDLDCTDYIDEGIGTLKCSAGCQIDASDCRQKDDVVIPECQGVQSKCSIEDIDGKLSNVLVTCIDEKWETTVCAGSCNGFSCIDCLEDDLVCNPPLCAEDNDIACFDDCCNAKEAFCDVGGIGACCSYDDVCGKHCCGEGTVCDHAVCRKACEFNRCVGTDDVEFCCDDAEICISNQCFKPSVTCVDNYACEDDQYCDPLLNQCMPQAQTQSACVRKPNENSVIPTLLWHWGLDAEVDCPQHLQVMATPMVADLDGDGYPEVIFNSFATNDHRDGVIRVVDGQTGKTKFTIKGKGDNACNLTVGAAQVSIGDLDGDGHPDIVTCAHLDRNTGEASNDLIAFRHDGSFLWQSGRTLDGQTIERYCGQSAPGIVDFDGDGRPEVYSSFTVVNGQTGEVKWQQPCELNQETSHVSYFNNGCEYSIAADLDDDGRPELVGGNVAWKADGSLFYKADPPFADGYPAVADVTLDGKPNIAVVDFHNHALRLLDNTGKVLWSVDTNEGIAEAGKIPGGGPPNIANIDDDAYPEITLAGGYAYQAYKYDGTRKWSKRSKDLSKKTGATIFDFSGNGKAEAVYADEEWLRVYDGATGATRFCIPNTSATHWEYPVIADVNADGSADIVVCSNNYKVARTDNALAIENGRDACVQSIIGPDPANPTLAADDPILAGTAGVRVFAAPNKEWVPTRKIWNQHAYSITNVRDDGTIPTTARANWQVKDHNNFRLNQVPDALHLPDLTVEHLSSSSFLCKDSVDLFFDIRNLGWAVAAPGIPVVISIVNDDNSSTEVGRLDTTQPILAGEALPMNFSYVNTNTNIKALSFIVTVGDQSIVLECKSDNNSSSYDYSCQDPIN